MEQNGSGLGGRPTPLQRVVEVGAESADGKVLLDPDLYLLPFTPRRRQPFLHQQLDNPQAGTLHASMLPSSRRGIAVRRAVSTMT